MCINILQCRDTYWVESFNHRLSAIKAWHETGAMKFLDDYEYHYLWRSNNITSHMRAGDAIIGRGTSVDYIGKQLVNGISVLAIKLHP